MAVQYGSLNVDERYSSILEPNLYHKSIFADGMTFTSKYEIGPSGGIFVHKLGTSACTVGTPGRDFVDEASADTLIPIVLNNNYQKSKKIYGVQASAVAFPIATEQLEIATQEVSEAWTNSGLGCLVTEGTASANTATALTKSNLKAQLLADRKAIVDAKGSADVLIMSTATYALMLENFGSEYTPMANDVVNATGQIGKWMGFTVIEASALSEAQFVYYDATGTKKTTKQPTAKNIDYIMYNHEALSIIPNFDVARIVDSENFNGSKAQVEMNCGFKVTSAPQVIVH